MMSNNYIATKIEGITLISLVITIVILLILAGISISAITSDNGLFSRAKQAKEETFKAEAKEEIEIALYNIHIKQINLKIEDINFTLLNNENKNIISYDINKHKGIYKIGNTQIFFKINNDLSVSISEYEYNKFIIINTEDEQVINWAEKLDVKSEVIISSKNINELVNDEELMKIFMESKPAIEYMIKDISIMNAIINSQVAMNKLGDSRDAVIAVINNSIAKNLVLNSDYADEFNNKNIISAELTGYVENLKCSSINSDLWAGWKVFDRNENTQWGAESNYKLPNWVEYNFGKEYLIYKVIVVNAFQSGMGPQSGTIYINDTDIGNYSVNTEKEPYIVNCLMQGSKIKVTLDKYNWQSEQSYLSEIYVYGIKM